jgi:hypothetical protein
MDESTYLNFSERKAIYPVKGSDRFASAHAPSSDKSGKSSARTRHTAQPRVERAYAYGTLMVAYDRHVLDIPWEEHTTNF